LRFAHHWDERILIGFEIYITSENRW